LLAVATLFVSYAANRRHPIPKATAEAHPVVQPAVHPGEYLFCFWNVENLFDDRDDHRSGPGDRTIDPWFARDSASLRMKLDHLSDAIVAMNGGHGPDILALAEVENDRAAALLVDSINARLRDPTLHYRTVLIKDPEGGRHIATALITRLPVQAARTKLLGRRLRILETHVTVQGHDLVVIASHWTSRVSDEIGNGREHYADQIYGAYKAMYQSNQNVDMIVCGDFNDPPEAESVTRHLHASGDRALVLTPSREPMLFDLMSGKDPMKFGTIWHEGHFYIFDHIAVSPGLLDSHGWRCDPDRLAVVNSLTRPGDKQHRPWRFGNEHEKSPRGYSDHFPVTVPLRVQDN
jgi:endonuclease/exonuclease/phosphatase family metal-dependent hydrolase